MEYSVADYGSMIADKGRMDAYVAALERAVKPGSVVVDIGTGTGIAALIACRLGARRVFAIEPSPVIEVARQVARDNGVSDRIEFFQESSLTVELPELADVVVSDLHGLLPFYGIHMQLVDDARKRFLKPGGVLIPEGDTVWCAPVEARRPYDTLLEVWRTFGLGFDMNAARDLVGNNFWKREDIGADDLLGEPQVVAALDYTSGAPSDATASLMFEARRDGSLHGLCMWFDARLLEEIGFSNAPGAGDLIYGRAFFPVPEQVEVSQGEQIGVEFAANLIGGDYQFRWSLTVGAPGAEPRARLRQSTFASTLLSAQMLRSGAESHAPTLGAEGRQTARAFELMDGSHTIAEIAAALTAEGGAPDEALALATRLSQRYGG